MQQEFCKEEQAMELYQKSKIQNMPKLTVAGENQNDFNMIMNDVTTYVQEMYIQFITGQADLEADWETYVNTINGMGLETALQYESEAYELYQAR